MQAIGKHVGSKISGRFEIVRLIGRGGMGTVYEARHDTLPRQFAVKILREDLAKNPDFVERFRREAIATAKIVHPNVIYITDFGFTDDGDVYLVMEYLEGIGLDKVLGQKRRLPIDRVLHIWLQLADALQQSHTMEVIHRDLKPENVLLTESLGRKDFVKLVDFGIAKLQSEQFRHQTLTMQGQVFGTAEYMSPEQATGEPIDGRSDIYALGCLAYEMLTGDPPFLGASMQVLRAHVYQPVVAPSTRATDAQIPAEIDDLVLKCLGKDPAERFANADALRLALLQAQQHLVPTAATLSIPPLNAPHIGELPIALIHKRAAPGPSPDQLREVLQDILRELAIGLVGEALAPLDMSNVLERLLVMEDELSALRSAITRAEGMFDRIRFDHSQREKQLRYAMMSLDIERAQLIGRATMTSEQIVQADKKIADLNYQIGALSKRCDEVETDCRAQIRELEQEVQMQRDQAATIKREAAQFYQTLHAQVESIRPSIGEQSVLKPLYARLDELQAQLRQMRSTG